MMYRATTLVFTALAIGACATNRPATLGSLNNSTVEIKQTGVEGVSTNKVMTRYRQFLDDVPANHPLYGRAINRLADLEMIEGDRKQFDDENKKVINIESSPKTNGFEKSQRNYQNAIDLYENLLASKSEEHRRDWILYQLSRAYEQSGNLEGAALSLQRLLKNFPTSQYMAESRFRLAELQYSLRNYFSASRAYLSVLDLGRGTPFYDKSIYKMGWSLFKQEKYEQALGYFFVAIELLPIKYGDDDRIQVTALNQLERDLLLDVLRAINLCFTYTGGPGAVDDYFNKNPNPSLEHEVFFRLADFYLAGDRVEDAAKTYEVYTQSRIATTEGAISQLLKIEVYTRSKFVQQALRAREEFVERFASRQSFWDSMSLIQRRNYGQRVMTIMRDLTSFYHARAQQKKKNADYAEAVKWYEIFIRLFPGVDTLDEQFLLAEIHYKQRRYRQAIQLFETVAYDLPKREKSANAGYTALLAHEKIISKKASPQNVTKNAYVDSAFRFLAWFPGDKRVISVQSKLAERLFELERYDEASLQASLVLEAKPTQTSILNSMRLILGHIAFDEKDYLGAIKYYSTLVSQKNWKNQNGSLNRKLAIAYYKQADNYRDTGQTNLAIESYRAAHTLTRDREVKAKALFDVATIYINDRQWGKAIPDLVQFTKAFPNHKLMEGVYEKLIAAYQSQGDLLKAADVMLAKVKLVGSADERRSLLWTAATAFKNAGKLSQAKQTFELHFKTYSEPHAEALESLYQILLISQRQKRPRERDRRYREIISYVEKSSLIKTDRGRYLISQGRFVLAEKAYKKYQKIALTLPLKRSLKRKQQAMEKALTAYEGVMKYSVSEYSTASTHRVAEIYANMGESVLKSSRPRGLSGEEKEMYDLQLEEQAFPFEEKAIELFELNARRVKDGHYDEWVKESLFSLKQLRPVRYAKEERMENLFDAIF